MSSLECINSEEIAITQKSIAPKMLISIDSTVASNIYSSVWPQITFVSPHIKRPISNDPFLPITRVELLEVFFCVVQVASGRSLFCPAVRLSCCCILPYFHVHAVIFFKNLGLHNILYENQIKFSTLDVHSFVFC